MAPYTVASPAAPDRSNERRLRGAFARCSAAGKSASVSDIESSSGGLQEAVISDKTEPDRSDFNSARTLARDRIVCQEGMEYGKRNHVEARAFVSSIVRFCHSCGAAASR